MAVVAWDESSCQKIIGLIIPPKLLPLPAGMMTLRGVVESHEKFYKFLTRRLNRQTRYIAVSIPCRFPFFKIHPELFTCQYLILTLLTPENSMI